MKINIKNLKGEVFAVEIEPTETISDLKEKIKTEKGFAVDQQKIIFKGKTTNNEDQIEKLGLKETDFLVVMYQVQKPQPKPKAEQKPANTQVQKKQEKKEEKKPENLPVIPQPSQENEAQINELMSMGFPRDKCVQALRAAFNNNQRAVEYLLNGIPAVGPAAESGGSGLSALNSLASLPQFNQIRQLIQNDPSALPNLLQQLSQTSPQLYNLIAEHPEEFERLIMEGGDVEIEGEGDEEDFGEEDSNENPPGTILITQGEEEAINRLANLGFSKLQAAQAYMACDKNEDLAANLLFDRLANGDIEGGFPSGPNQGNQGGDEDDDNLFN